MSVFGLADKSERFSGGGRPSLIATGSPVFGSLLGREGDLDSLAVDPFLGIEGARGAKAEGELRAIAIDKSLLTPGPKVPD